MYRLKPASRPARPGRRGQARLPAQPLPANTLLKLMWLASPALPVGGLSYSEGLSPA